MNKLTLINSLALAGLVIYLFVRRKPKHIPLGSWLIDTSALIDGRVVVLATQLRPLVMVVPDAVIRELQVLADGRDKLKRERASQGFSTLELLQATQSVRVLKTVSDHRVVDDLLLEMAVAMDLTLITNDLPLAKRAKANKAACLHLQSLTVELQTQYQIDEVIEVNLSKVGEKRHQAIGYLEDGSMIVVQQASKYLNRRVKARITHLTQTASGRLFFAVLEERGQ